MTALSTRSEQELSLVTEAPVARPHPPDPAGPHRSRVVAAVTRLRSRVASRRTDRRLTPRDAALHGGDPHLKYHSFPRHLR